jgi:hypothetical protein
MVRLAIALALTACVDLTFEPNDFACTAGGPCPPDGGDAPADDSGSDGGTVAECLGGPNGCWRRLSVTGAVARSGHSAVVDTIRNRALIFGGADSELAAFSLSEPLAFEPVALAGTLPPSRIEHAAAFIEEDTGEMMIFGGLDASNRELGDSWRLSFFGGAWTRHEDLASPRHSAAAAELDSAVSYLAIISGCDSAGPLAGDHQFDVIINMTGELTSEPPRPTARCDHTATYVPDVGTLIFGGRASAALGDLWSLNEITIIVRRWTQLTDGPARSGHTTVFDASRNRLLVFGGLDSNGVRLQDVWAYSIDDQSWVQLEPEGTAPSPRAQHAAFLLGGKMIVYGGDDGSPRDDVWELSF